MARARKSTAHGMFFFSALMIAAISIMMRGGNAAVPTGDAVPEEQAILAGHAGPVSLSVIRGVRSGLEVVEFEPDAALFLTVPATWTLREVRGAVLENVQSEPGGTGYTRWTLPSGSRFSFLTDKATHLTVHGAGSGTLLLKIRHIDLQNELTRETTQLLKEGKIQLW